MDRIICYSLNDLGIMKEFKAILGALPSGAIILAVFIPQAVEAGLKLNNCFRFFI